MMRGVIDVLYSPSALLLAPSDQSRWSRASRFSCNIGGRASGESERCQPTGGSQQRAEWPRHGQTSAQRPASRAWGEGRRREHTSRYLLGQNP